MNACAAAIAGAGAAGWILLLPLKSKAGLTPAAKSAAACACVF